MSSEFDGVLDLTGADTSVGAFEAIPTGKYQGHIHEAVWKFTTNTDGTGKLPDNTPYLNVQYRIDEDEPRKMPGGEEMKVKNRVVFHKLFVPPPGYDAEKASKMKGSMVNFLKAAGYEDKDIQSKKFKIDPDDLQGRQLTIIVRRYKNDYTEDWDNEVQGVKPAGETSAQSAGMLV